MSSESKVRTFAVECLRFPGEGQSSQGKSGTKPRAKAVGDDQQVDIPVLPNIDKDSKQGRRRIVYPHGWKCAAKSWGEQVVKYACCKR
jgi:hypothetical protein